MIPWIQVYSNLITHPKTARLAKELKLKNSFTAPAVMAAGIVVAIWTWAVQSAYDGDLSDVPDETIADACRWQKDPEELTAALIASGFMEKNRQLHDWEDYTMMYQDLQDDAKQKHRERQQRYRERQKVTSL